jgi:hypothetical protein
MGAGPCKPLLFLFALPSDLGYSLCMVDGQPRREEMPKLKMNTAAIEKGMADYSLAARDLVGALVGWELISPLNLPQNVRAALEKAKAARDIALDTPLYIEDTDAQVSG